jgi:hypothetical protein
MRDSKKPSPHRLTHEERAAFMPVDLSTMQPGDVFVREGAPHMRCNPPADVAHLEGEGIWIVNLRTGGCWAAKPNQQVHPAHDVKLTFSSGRREG